MPESLQCYSGQQCNPGKDLFTDGIQRKVMECKSTFLHGLQLGGTDPGFLPALTASQFFRQVHKWHEKEKSTFNVTDEDLMLPSPVLDGNYISSSGGSLQNSSVSWRERLLLCQTCCLPVRKGQGRSFCKSVKLNFPTSLAVLHHQHLWMLSVLTVFSL